MEHGVQVLVTGAAGFIGSHLIPKLAERGYEVCTLQRHITGRYVLGEQARTAVFCDLRDFFAVRKAIAELQPEAVFHLAAISPVAYSYDHPQEVFSVNTIGTINLAEACLREVPFFKHFLFAGTSEEYGIQTEFPIKEDVEVNIIPSTIPKRPLDIPVLVSDNSKAKQVLGWSPRFTLEQGLKLTIDYWKERLS